MRDLPLSTAGIPFRPALLMLVLLTLAACSPGAAQTPAPEITPRAGPTWTPQRAIEVIDATALATGDLAWNAEFDPYLGRWQVTLIYSVRMMYPAREERRTLLWYVYEDTGRVEGPLR